MPQLLFRRRLIISATIACLIPKFTSAQASAAEHERHAAVTGLVYDSIGNAPLSDAIVQLVSGDFVRTSTTDAQGKFVLQDIPVGRYTIGFLHPVLDSIGIGAPLREVVIENANPFHLNLAVPSTRRIRVAICRSMTADTGAVIVGNVRDATSGAPAPGVTIRGEWLEYVLTRSGISRRLGHLSTTTTESGWFALCNVPGSGVVALTAARGADSTGSVEVQMPPDGYARREIYIGTHSTELVDEVDEPKASESRAVATLPRRKIHIGDGRVAGKVVSTATGRPLASAQITIVDGPSTRTDGEGNFLFINAPMGTQTVEVRAVGYYPNSRQVNVVPGSAALTVSLSTLKAVLDTVRIRASRLPSGPDDGGFNRRRRMGLGKYVGPEDMRRFPVINTADVFRRIPRMRTDGAKLLMRGAFPTSQGQLRGEFWCEPSVFIDGANMSFMSIEDINDWVHPDDVKGIEVYSEGTSPPQFQVGLSGCGSVVIWTK